MEKVKNWAPKLDEKLVASLFIVSPPVESINRITTYLPSKCKAHFENLQKLGDPKEPFLYRFLCFLKSEDEGILVGFGVDKDYYVLSAWNKDRIDLWQPRVSSNN